MSFRAVLLLTLALAIAAQAGCGDPRHETADPAAEKAGIELAREGEPAVEVVIDYGDGVQKRFVHIPHNDGMTASQALEFADRHPRGIQFRASGSGAAALITRIDDLSNESGGEGKNWLYRVNGKLADKSAGAYVLSPGDVIVWKYEIYE